MNFHLENFQVLMCHILKVYSKAKIGKRTEDKMI